MLQLFYKTSSISSHEWDKAYKRIESIASNFPLKLMRIEAYYGYEPHLDKDHFDLKEHIDTEEECLSFYGDWDSYTTGTTIRFYKNWEKYVSIELTGKEKDPNKPITWFPHYPFRNDGTLPQANGQSTKYEYVDTRNAAYQYAIIAIGIMLENLLPQKVFLIAPEIPSENIEDVMIWLETHFKEQFELPIYFDKIRLLSSFKQEYTEKAHVVCRMEHLFRKQHKRNIAFAIENIGYKPTFDCYADILSSNTFGTFGFSDVLDPWIAVTQDLESTLEIIAASKNLTIERRDKQETKEYDLTVTLKGFLGKFILWTPQQREELAHFYTNEEALETGDESLWGMMYRMTGNRVDICPMYATQQELFEAFMFHEPQKGKIFKTIIDEWLEKNAHAFDKLKQKLSEQESQSTAIEEQGDEEEEEEGINMLEKEKFLSQYPKHEQPFIELAIHKNPAILDVEKGIQDLIQRVQNIVDSPEHQDHLKAILLGTNKENIEYIKKRLKKDIRCSVHPNFEQWLNKENNKTVLFYLTLMMSIKIYDRNSAYIRYRFLWDKENWRVWESVNLNVGS